MRRLKLNWQMAAVEAEVHGSASLDSNSFIWCFDGESWGSNPSHGFEEFSEVSRRPTYSENNPSVSDFSRWLGELFVTFNSSGLRYSATNYFSGVLHKTISDKSFCTFIPTFSLTFHHTGCSSFLVSLTGISFGFVWYHSNVFLPFSWFTCYSFTKIIGTLTLI